YDTKLNTMFAAGTPPDLFYLSAENMSKMAGLGLLHSLDDLVQDDIAATGEDWLADFFPVLLDTFRFDGTTQGVGPLYGVAKDMTPMVMYANLDLFRRANVEVPYDGWTWDEFDVAMERISALDDPGGKVYGSVVASWPAVLRQTLWTYGGDYFNGSDFGDVTLDEPEAMAALQRIRDMRFGNEANGVPITSYNATSGDSQGLGEQEFYTGRVGVVGPIGRWRTPRFRDIRAFDWDVVPFPHGAGVEPATALATVSWSMSVNTRNPEKAFRLLKFLAGPEGQKLTAASGLAVPCARSVANSELFLQSDQRPKNSKLFVELMETARVGQMPPQAEFGRILNEEVEQAIRLDNQSIAVAAEAIERRWLAELESPLRNDAFPKMPWLTVGAITTGGLAVAVVGLVLWLRREKLGAIDRAQERAGRSGEALHWA
ncbi:MAG: sugar ABC transporter substrate-binding protein, partial [Planctomycetota bacterium]